MNDSRKWRANKGKKLLLQSHVHETSYTIKYRDFVREKKRGCVYVCMCVLYGKKRNERRRDREIVREIVRVRE